MRAFWIKQIGELSDVEKNLGGGVGSNYYKYMWAFWTKQVGLLSILMGISLSHHILRESFSLNLMELLFQNIVIFHEQNSTKHGKLIPLCYLPRKTGDFPMYQTAPK